MDRDPEVAAVEDAVQAEETTRKIQETFTETFALLRSTPKNAKPTSYICLRTSEIGAITWTEKSPSEEEYAYSIERLDKGSPVKVYSDTEPTTLIGNIFLADMQDGQLHSDQDGLVTSPEFHTAFQKDLVELSEEEDPPKKNPGKKTKKKPTPEVPSSPEIEKEQEEPVKTKKKKTTKKVDSPEIEADPPAKKKSTRIAGKRTAEPETPPPAKKAKGGKKK